MRNSVKLQASKKSLNPNYDEIFLFNIPKHIPRSASFRVAVVAVLVAIMWFFFVIFVFLVIFDVRCQDF